ncbi:MAG TPA: hypothetical protein VJP76_04230 [Candidatus Tumulicola sp.]|nr:hypothetical protein [Candidatus Tumulicola sp.]
MKTTIGFVFSSLVAAALLAGCNGNGNNTTPPGTGTNCGNPPPGVQVLYPRNGAPHVPSNNGNAVYIAAKPALVVGNSYDFYAVQSSGFTQFTSTFATTSLSNVPNPHASPTPGATIYVTQMQYPVGPLQTVQLFWNDGGTGCNPNVLVSSYSTGQ